MATKTRATDDSQHAAIESAAYYPEIVALDDLTDHPRNYREHPDDQLEHLMASLKAHGWYRNVIVARDNTLLAGHGIVKAARKLGLQDAPVIRLDLDPNEPAALKVLAGDNEAGRLAEIDDRALSELLKEVKDFDADGLLGTGYDAAMLANLVYVTRPASEIQDFDEAKEWVGMPEYPAPEAPLTVLVRFRSEADRAAFARLIGIELSGNRGSFMWPPVQERDDVASIRLEESAA